MSLLKLGFVITAISGLILLPPAALPQVVCFGLNCPGEDDYTAYQPGQPNGFSNWDTYSIWRGLNAGLHIPNDVPILQCFSHCMDHGQDAEDACLDSVDIDPDDDASFICEQVYWSVITNCQNQCQDNPH